MDEGFKKSTSKRNWKWLIVVMLLALGITLLVVRAANSRVHSLWEIATQEIPKERFHEDQFTWLSNKELVYLDKSLHILIGNIRWLPDGKRVSFVYDGALWTTPVSGGSSVGR